MLNERVKNKTCFGFYTSEETQDWRSYVTRF